jgi:hypothetical protein
LKLILISKSIGTGWKFSMEGILNPKLFISNQNGIFFYEDERFFQTEETKIEKKIIGKNFTFNSNLRNEKS